MTSLREWIDKVEFDAPNEAKKLYDAIVTNQGNEMFLVHSEIEEGITIQIITKNGYKPKLEIRSIVAEDTILEIIKDDFLPLKSLK